ncbi:MAG: phosphatidate cytidylyltransferase, partial [Clostridia bacterium]|nr:phosphatidate cytidylyltransferase [Clostridia bacterium]
MTGLLHGVLALLIYFAAAASIALISRVLIQIPDELFRKILHCILLGSLIIFVFCFNQWLHSAASAVVFAVLVYPVLAWFERFKGFSKLTTERKKGELKE